MNKFKELLFLKQLKGIGNTTINKKYIPLLNGLHGFEELVDLVSEREKKLTPEEIDEACESAKEKYNHIINMADVVVVTVFDDNYPKKLLDLKDKKPVILYVKGDVTLLNSEGIAVIGTRKPSEWSQKVEERLVSKILEISDKTIVSGLALGCDKIAHQTTVELKGKTIAVMPSGVNVIAPAAHRDLAKEILQTGGCLVSEYEPDANATKYTLVERDAVVAALAQAVVVIECGVASGTMHAVKAADEMQRRLACYYTADKSKGTYDGNYKILTEKKAAKVSATEELQVFLEQLDSKVIIESEPKQMTLFDMGDSFN